jgi:DNA-directed RNA polymerase subunit RPC12/RpoP
MMLFACPACRSLNESPEHLAGSKVACRVCGQRLLVPGLAPAKTLLGQPVPDSPAPRPDLVEPVKEAPAAEAGRKVSIPCPACDCSIRVKEKHLGRQASCPACGASILLSLSQPPRPPAQPLTAACPGCGRTIPLQAHELSLTFECARCGTHFVPSQVAPLSEALAVPAIPAAVPISATPAAPSMASSVLPQAIPVESPPSALPAVLPR